MTIKRGNQEIELTFTEMMEAYEEYRLDCAIEDVKGLCEQADIKLTDAEMGRIARDALHSLGKNDLYFEAYWDTFQYYLNAWREANNV